MRIVPAVRRLIPGATLFVFCAVLCTAGCEVGKAPVALETLLARAVELGEKGFYTEAAAYLRSQVDAVPAADRGRVRFEMARLYHRGGIYDLALSSAEAAMGLGIKDAELLYIQADSRRQRHVPGAEECFQKLLEQAPGHAQGQLGLARIRLRSADPASALPLFDGYFKAAAPGDADFNVALLEHARALRNVGRHQEAADRHALLLEEDPLEGAYYSGLAESLYRLKLPREGRFVEEIYQQISKHAFEEHVEDRLRETGATAFALAQRAANRTRQRRYLEAFRSYLQALEVDGADPRPRIFFADLCIQFRRPRDARAVLNDALQKGMQPASGLWWALGRVHLEEEGFRDARRAFEAGAGALRAEGDQGGQERGQAPEFSLHLALGRACLETGEIPAARQAIARAAEIAPQGWEPLYWLGRIELQGGNHGKAL